MKRTAIPHRTKPLKPSSTPIARTGILRVASVELSARAKKRKPPKCKVCRNPFTRERASQLVCGTDCGIEHARLKREKAERIAAKVERQAIAAQKVAAEPLKVKLKRAEKAINRWVRARDYWDGCISCDKPPHWDGVWHASHFKAVGSNSVLRYNLFNIHKSCAQCNLFKSGNIGEYAKRLVLKIRQDRVDWLDTQNGVKRYEPEYLDRLAKVANKRAKRIEDRNKNLHAFP